jgi:hypothetical protein
MNPHLLRLDPCPEIGEFDGAEERDHCNDFFVTHTHVPRVGVSVRFSVAGGRLRVEQRDLHVTVGVETSDGRHQPARKPRIERVDYEVKELLTARVGPGDRCVANDRPLGVGRQEVENASRSVPPCVEARLDNLSILCLDILTGIHCVPSNWDKQKTNCESDGASGIALPK